ncbi:MAG: hypothetical protein AAF658_14545, partial [Myxococcota bacterium]
MTVAALALGTAACGDDEEETVPQEDEGPEVFTTVILTFSPDGGTAGDDIVVQFEDPDGDGVQNGVFTYPNSGSSALLAADTDYTLAVSFRNILAPDPDEIQEEIAVEEDDEHQILFFGSNVNGPATTNTSAPITHTYADMDENMLPVGVINNIETSATAAAAGPFSVLLRHLPPVNGTAEKVAGLAAAWRDNGETGFPGETDIRVDFSIGVAAP